MGNDLSKILMRMPKHAGGTVAEPSTFDKLLGFFKMKPSTDALGQASQTTQPPSSSEKAYTYDGSDFVKKAAEEAGKRNAAAQAQKASANTQAKPMAQHAEGAISSPTGPGGTVGPSLMGNYGRPSPVAQRTAQLPNPMPSVNAPGAMGQGPGMGHPTQQTPNLYRPGGPINQPPMQHPMAGQMPQGPPPGGPPPTPLPGQPPTGPPAQAPPGQPPVPSTGQRPMPRYGRYPMAG